MNRYQKPATWGAACTTGQVIATSQNDASHSCQSDGRKKRLVKRFPSTTVQILYTSLFVPAALTSRTTTWVRFPRFQINRHCITSHFSSPFPTRRIWQKTTYSSIIYYVRSGMGGIRRSSASSRKFVTDLCEFSFFCWYFKETQVVNEMTSFACVSLW